MVGAGYEGHLEPWDARWGQRYAIVKDPDGNAVDLFAAL
ncbi:MAG TPA: VOC family protein [Streptosporangiaceae bacterium]|nr:VOC family protein [Streptosporangiaceae bacterium]